jgi:hypothetical protein
MTLSRFGKFATLLLACWTGTIAYSQSVVEVVDLEHPAIGYRTRPANDAVAVLNGRLQNGEQQLRFDNATGYVRSLLEALDVPVESQILVYSKTSLQQTRISPDNPRAIFFNDSVAVAWVPGGFIEVAVHSPHHGGVFYLLPQTPTPTPRFS